MKFGTIVVVKAELVRVRCNGPDPTDKTLLQFQPARPHRDYGRYESCKYVFEPSDTWPGVPAEPDRKPRWSTPELLEPEGEAARRTVRCRRFPQNVPTLGVVIGATTKEEGCVTPGSMGMEDYDPGYLNHYRTIKVLEVAVQTDEGRKGRIILAHPSDVVVFDV